LGFKKKLRKISTFCVIIKVMIIKTDSICYLLSATAGGSARCKHNKHQEKQDPEFNLFHYNSSLLVR